MGSHAGRLEAKIVSRGQGHSAVSKAAYNARCTLENDRLGTRDDYSRKNAECLFSGIYAPKNAPEWTRDREQLWNHVEAFEKRKDSQLARELLIDLAHELTPEQNRYVLQDFIRENFTRKGLVVDAAIHAPHKHSNARNIHAHVMVVFRHLDGTEFEAGKPRHTKAENVAELDAWDRSFEKLMNKSLERHGFEPRWDLRSNKARGLDREPEIHLGKAAAALERQGIETVPGDLNREIRERNRERAAANENDRGPDLAADIQAARDELARLEAMAQEFDSRDYGDQAPDYEPGQDDLGHGHDEGGDLSHEREAEAEAHAREAMAAFEAERAALRREIHEHNERVAELDAINEDVRDQFRQQREALNAAEFMTTLDAMRAREAQQRGDDSASRAAHAMDDLARTDPLGTARSFGYHAGDRLKSPEEMRREWASLMRGGVAADRAADRPQDLGRDLPPAPEPTPEAAPQLDQVDAQSRDPLAERTAWADRLRRFDMPDPVAQRGTWAERLRGFITPARQPERDHTAERAAMAERLRGFAAEAAQEAHREARPGRTPDRTPEPDRPPQAPENKRGGVFQKLRGFVRGWFETTPQPEPQRDRAADRQHDHAGATDHQRSKDQMSQEQWGMPHEKEDKRFKLKPDKKMIPTLAEGMANQPEPEPQLAPERPRPAERLRQSIADEWLAKAKAKLEAERAAETPEQRAEYEKQAAERSRGDGSRERTRYHHSPLWELMHPFQHHHHTHRRSREP